MIKEVVCFIDEKISCGLALDSAQFKGLAEYMLQTFNEKDVRVPGVIDANGELTYVGFDDVDSFRCYHRISAPIAYGLDPKGATGNSRGHIVRTVQMSLFVMASRKLNLLSEELEQKITTLLPMEAESTLVESLKYRSMKIIHINSDLDGYTVFQKEFNMPANRLKNIMLFEVKYKIECVYKDGCINTCINSN